MNSSDVCVSTLRFRGATGGETRAVDDEGPQRQHGKRTINWVKKYNNNNINHELPALWTISRNDSSLIKEVKNDE